MLEISEEFWWVLFPIGAVMAIGWSQWVSYMKAKAVLEALREYSKAGREPPEHILEGLEQPGSAGLGLIQLGSVRTTFGTIQRLVIWASMAVGFEVGSFTVKEQSVSETLRVVAIVLACLTVASLAVLAMRRTRS
jgi:hypothetical protein